MGETAQQNATPKTPQWRVSDTIIAAVLGMSCGLLFWLWNSVGFAWFTAFDALTLGLGVWLLCGVLGGLVIRKPGAARFVKVIAAVVAAVLGNHWGIDRLYSGLMQGLGAELVFVAFRYRRFTWPVAVLAGIGAGIGAYLLELVPQPNTRCRCSSPSSTSPGWWCPVHCWRVSSAGRWTASLWDGRHDRSYDRQSDDRGGGDRAGFRPAPCLAFPAGAARREPRHFPWPAGSAHGGIPVPGDLLYRRPRPACWAMILMASRPAPWSGPRSGGG